jgi:VIT1/CCC1 family predicted Fe2+/Mn2+ transporter
VRRGANENLYDEKRFVQFVTITRINSMNLALWLLAMFALGILAMGLCYLFLIACEKI